jgi:hypothetical protein
MSAIFLSYRRDDSSGYAGRLFDNLAERFGRERVFMDIETLEPGMDFVAGIDRAIESCGAVIAMIGPNWVKAQDVEGHRRLDNPHDFIRLEITSALTRNVRVIPVLVHNASMPSEQELPEPLRPLCRLQASEISDNRWEFDVRRLADVLEPLIAENEESPTAGPSAAKTPAAETGTGTTPGPEPDGRATGWLAVVAAVVLAAGGGAWWLSQPSSNGQAPATVENPMQSPPETTAGSNTAATAVPSPEPPMVPVPPAEKMHLEPPPAEASPNPPAAAETESVAAPEIRGPSPDDLRQAEIAELLGAAEIDMAELRLTRPPGNNAFERFQRVLELEPHNPAAREGLIVITERYHGLAGEALDRGALDRAQRHLDSARLVDPDADWLTPVQREIDEQRQEEAQAMHRPEPATHTDAAYREACLAECENRHRSCREEIDPQTEENCLRNHEMTCEQRYESCMSDPSKLFMGEVSRESDCIGIHIECRKSIARDCATAAQNPERQCEAQMETCTQRCQNAE